MLVYFHVFVVIVLRFECVRLYYTFLLHRAATNCIIKQCTIIIHIVYKKLNIVVFIKRYLETTEVATESPTIRPE